MFKYGVSYPKPINRINYSRLFSVFFIIVGMLILSALVIHVNAYVDNTYLRVNNDLVAHA